jgi:enoyl-CoA hydratase/carnithine racemase
MFALEIRDGIARLTLERPAVRNAVPVAGWDELAAKVAQAEAGGARLLVVAGSPGAFCAGADLADFPAMRGDEAAAASFRAAMRRGLDALSAVPVPTIALVEGACFGAGVALAAACDIRLAGPGARFAVTPARMGISFPLEDVHRLVALVGAGHSARLLLGGGAIDAAEAKRIGLVEGDSAELEAFAAAVLANHPTSITVLKHAVALAARGVRSDDAQDRSFDALLAGDALAARLEARRRR